MNKVKVTQDHIDRGTPESSSSCPIALCLKEEFATLHVDVDVLEGTRLSILINGKELQVSNPKRLINFIIGFDNYGKTSSYVKPMFIEYEPTD
jgi:hypothetical protein